MPGSEYVCVAVGVVASGEPSPKDQVVEVTPPSLSVELEVNVTASGAAPEFVDRLPIAVGGWLADTTICTVAESVAPPPSVTVSVAVYVPGVA